MNNCVRKKHTLLRLIVTNIYILLFTAIILGIIVCDVNADDSVGKVRLNIETYLAGQDQPTHPSVIGFDNKWNGYRFWMVYTPYPEANGEEENPSIAVSNDLYKWETPYGMTNPISYNEETGCNELKDGHILYRNDLNRLEIWYLGRVSKNLGGDGNSLTLFRKYSYDGIIWSSYEIMDKVEYLSPSIIWDGNKYKMWSIGFDTYKTTGTLVYQESKNGFDWTEPIQCSIGNQIDNLELWHGAVSYDSTNNIYYFVYIPDANNSQTIELCESNDGIHFTENQSIIKNDKKTLWKRFYRPCLLVYKEEYHLFYGVITEDNKWYISYSKGKSLHELKGITSGDCSKMVTLRSDVIDTNSIGYIFRTIYHSICNDLRPETGLIILVILFLDIILKQRQKRIFFKLVCSVLLSVVYTFRLFKPSNAYGICAAYGAGILEGVCIFCISMELLKLLYKLNKIGSVAD